MNKKRKIRLFIILGILGVLFLNLALISGYILINSYGKMNLNPGEKYIINIPFKIFQSPVVSGKAQQTDGTPISGIKVIVNDSDNAVIGEGTTNSNGEYSITLPKISEEEQVYVYLQYDNASPSLSNLALASNDYNPDFKNNLNYSKGSDNSVYLNGKITNRDAEVNDGRFKVTLSSCQEETTTCDNIIETKQYALNIKPGEVYVIPNKEMDYSWPITGSTDTGKYKIYTEASFNGKEHTSTIYFHINP
jgi:hypothetical protein